MSVASRQREVDRIERINARTPDWARDQIARQRAFHHARRALHSAKSASMLTRVTLAHAMSVAMGALSVIWTKRAKQESAVNRQLEMYGSKLTK